MARYKPKHMKKSKPNKTLNGSGILINALIDLLIGIVLILIEKMME